MADYIKISDGVYEEVPVGSPKRVLLNELNAQIDELQAQKDALINPTNQELIDFAKLTHPFYVSRDNINNQLDDLRALKAILQAL
jgi:hypothetical protein